MKGFVRSWSPLAEFLSYSVAVIAASGAVFYSMLPRTKFDTDRYLILYYIKSAAPDLALIVILLSLLIAAIKLLPWRKLYRFVVPQGASKVSLALSVLVYTCLAYFAAMYLTEIEKFRRIGANFWRDAVYASELRGRFYSEQIEKNLQKRLLRDINDDIWLGNFPAAASKFQRLNELIPDVHQRLWKERDAELPRRIMQYADYMVKSADSIKERKGYNRNSFFRLIEAFRLRRTSKEVSDAVSLYVAHLKKASGVLPDLINACRASEWETASKQLREWKWFIFEEEVINVVEKEGRKQEGEYLIKRYCDALSHDDADSILRRILSSWQFSEAMNLLKAADAEVIQEVAQTYRNDRTNMEDFSLACFTKNNRLNWTGVLTGYSAIRFGIIPERVCYDRSLDSVFSDDEVELIVDDTRDGNEIEGRIKDLIEGVNGRIKMNN